MQSNPVAMITGASRGIGRAAALYFAEQGYDVALIARNKEKLEALQQEIEQRTKGKVKTGVFALDVSDRNAIDNAVDQIVKAHKRIDVLFNSAGVFTKGTSDIDLDEMHAMVHVNLLGAYYCIHAVTPIMKQQKSGTIINLASRAGKRGLAGSGAYCMTKFGLVGLNESLYKELLPYNIRVTAICPSVIDTEMTASFGTKNKDKITTADIMTTVNYIMSLSPTAAVPEIVINCPQVDIDTTL